MNCVVLSLTEVYKKLRYRGTNNVLRPIDIHEWLLVICRHMRFTNIRHKKELQRGEPLDTRSELTSLTHSLIQTEPSTKHWNHSIQSHKTSNFIIAKSYNINNNNNNNDNNKAETLGLEFNTHEGLVDTPLPRIKAKCQAAAENNLMQQHCEKAMHGVFFGHIEACDLLQELTFQFLRWAGLKSETEGFILACQDGAIVTLTYRGCVMKLKVLDINCRICHTAPEMPMHLISACPLQASSGYVYRYKAAVRVL